MLQHLVSSHTSQAALISKVLVQALPDIRSLFSGTAATEAPRHCKLLLSRPEHHLWVLQILN